MGIVVVPLFPDVELQEWISWMENYFDRKGHTDFEKLHMAHGFIWGEAERYIDSLKPMSSWKEMKETLLLRFGEDDDPEKIKLENEDRRYREQVIERVRKTESEILQETPTNLEEVTLSSESLIQVSKTTSDDIEKDSQLGYQGIENRDGPLMNDLLERFGPVQSCSSVAAKLKDESYCHSEVVPEIVVVNKTSSPTEEDVFAGLETEVTNPYVEEVSVASVAGAHQKQMILAPVQETEAILKNSVAESDHRTDLQGETGPVLSCLAKEVPPKLESTLSKELVPEPVCVKKTTSQTDAEVFVRFGHCLSLGCASPELSLEQDSVFKTVHEPEVMISSDTENTEKNSCMEKQRRCPKAWKFKFKTRHFQKFGFRRLMNLKPVSELEVGGVFCGSEHQLSQTRVIPTLLLPIALEEDLYNGDWWYKIVDGKLVNYWTSLFQYYSVRIEKLRRWHEKMIRSVGRFQVKHKWRFRQLNQSYVLQLSDVNKGIMSMRDHNHFSVLLQQRGVVWLWVCFDFLMAVADTRPEWQRFLIIFFCSSLRASLVSRAGVYERILTWFRRLNVLIWWFSTVNGTDVLDIKVGKHEEMTEPSTQLEIQVVNHQLCKERRAVLLMLFKRCMLHTLIQERQKWKKKSYKTGMFKYKARLKQVLGLPLHVVLCHWGSSSFVWHRWRSKGDSLVLLRRLAI